MKDSLYWWQHAEVQAEIKQSLVLKMNNSMCSVWPAQFYWLAYPTISVFLKAGDQGFVLNKKIIHTIPVILWQWYFETLAKFAFLKKWLFPTLRIGLYLFSREKVIAWFQKNGKW